MEKFGFCFIKTILQSSKPYSNNDQITNKLEAKGFLPSLNIWNFYLNISKKSIRKSLINMKPLHLVENATKNLCQIMYKWKSETKEFVLKFYPFWIASMRTFWYLFILFFLLLSVSKGKLFKWIEIHKMLSNSSENIIKSET